MSSMGGMFAGCINLESIDVSTFDTKNANDMSSMFYKCTKLEYIDLGNFDTRKVEAMFMMFDGCTNLKRVNISSFDTNNVMYFHLMFNDCINLEFLNITHFVFHPDLVQTYYDSMFDNDAKLHLIITSDFYYNIIDLNEYLERIEENVTIIR